MTADEKKEYFRKYYQLHKEEINKRQKEWRKTHKKEFFELVYKSRRKRAEELKKQGIKYPWKSNIERKKLNERIKRSDKTNEVQDNDDK